jgi:predicted branched-subunit amino acid permease
LALKSFAVEGTVFWLLASAIASIPLAYYPGSQFIAISVVVTAIYLALAYLCWRENPRGFIAAIILAVFVIVMDIVFSGLRYPGDELLLALQLLIIFFGYRGYRELGSA